MPVGLSTYIATKTFENYISASLNAGAGLIYKVSGKNKNIGKYIGKGQGMTFNQANAYQFGMMQALLEVFGGTGKNFLNVALASRLLNKEQKLLKDLHHPKEQE